MKWTDKLGVRLARRFQHTRDLEKYLQNLEDYILLIDNVVRDLRSLLPGEQKPMATFDILETFAEQVVLDIGTLMAACVDYRNVLIRADVPDSVSGRHPGVEEIFKKYGVELSKRKQGHKDLFTVRIGVQGGIDVDD